MRLSLRLPRLQRRRSWSSHHCRCCHLFRRWRHPLLVLVKLALDLSPRLLPFLHGHRRRCCWRKTPERFSSAAHHPAAVIGKKLLILCTRMPLLTLQTCALLHGLDHVHLDLGYFGTKGLSSALATLVEAFAPAFRLRGISPLFSSLSVRVATTTTAGGC
jgi:hypothetical protein